MLFERTVLSILSIFLTALFLGFLVTSRPVKRLQNLQLSLCVESAEEFQQPVERRTGTSSSNFERVVAAFRVVVSSGIVRQGAIVVVPRVNRIERVVEPVRFKVGDGSCERTGSRCSYIAMLLATSPSACRILGQTGLCCCL